jgi:hypothetical protein
MLFDGVARHVEGNRLPTVVKDDLRRLFTVQQTTRRPKTSAITGESALEHAGNLTFLFHAKVLCDERRKVSAQARGACGLEDEVDEAPERMRMLAQDLGDSR